jgi:hypothetical protein
MTITIELDTDKLRGKIEDRLAHAQLALDNEVLKDSNYWAPRREDTLMRSGHIPEPGTVEWDEIYARNHYYEGGTFKEGDGPKQTTWKRNKKNPNASPLWFEHAKARNMKKWEKVANEEYYR